MRRVREPNRRRASAQRLRAAQLLGRRKPLCQRHLARAALERQCPPRTCGDSPRTAARLPSASGTIGPPRWGSLRSCSKIAFRPQRAEAGKRNAHGAAYTDSRAYPDRHRQAQLQQHRLKVFDEIGGYTGGSGCTHYIFAILETVRRCVRTSSAARRRQRPGRPSRPVPEHVFGWRIQPVVATRSV